MAFETQSSFWFNYKNEWLLPRLEKYKNALCKPNNTREEDIHIKGRIAEIQETLRQEASLPEEG